MEREGEGFVPSSAGLNPLLVSLLLTRVTTLLASMATTLLTTTTTVPLTTTDTTHHRAMPHCAAIWSGTTTERACRWRGREGRRGKGGEKESEGALGEREEGRRAS